MRSTNWQFIIAATLLLDCSSAFPLNWSPKNILPKRVPQAPSYSVVAVDGGNTTPVSSAVPAATKTVTDAVTEVQTATVLATVVATPSNSSPVTITISPTPETTQPAVTSIPYDNGQWHTTYYFRTTVTPQAEANIAAPTGQASSASPTASVDLGQWSYWSQRQGNGGS